MEDGIWRQDGRAGGGGEEVVLHPKQLKAEGRRVYLPLYMAHLV